MTQVTGLAQAWGGWNPRVSTGIPTLLYNGQTLLPSPGMLGGAYDFGNENGLFYNDQDGSYFRPSPNGMGWELGAVGDMFYYNNLAGDPNFAATPVKMSWTPDGGWVLLQAPDGVTIDPTSLPPDNRFEIVDSDGNVLFDSDNFVPGTLPSSESIAAWDNILNTYYNNYPQYTNHYTPHSDILALNPDYNSNSGSGDVYTVQAIELNKGLSFQDGQWVPLP